MRGRVWSAGSPCYFEDSNGKCWKPGPHGLCSAPSSGAAALVQHSDFDQLCKYNPPYGFRPLCSEKGGQEALKMLRSLRDPAKCFYQTCAVVGASGNLLSARLGSSIDSHDAVIRINFAPDGRNTARLRTAPHRHEPTWIADLGERTTWRVLTMEGYGYLTHYPRLWLQPPRGHGKHANMSGIPQEPLLAVSCHQPGTQGRCRAERLEQVFAHAESASYLINPLLLGQTARRFFSGVRNQKTLSTGMTAIAFAQQMCGQVHIYGFGNGSCGGQCYHFYDCGPTSKEVSQEHFFTKPEASQGFHNFSAQASTLLRMASDGIVVPHWGSCDRRLGDPPPEHASIARARGRTGRGRGGRRGGRMHRLRGQAWA